MLFQFLEQSTFNHSCLSEISKPMTALKALVRFTLLLLSLNFLSVSVFAESQATTSPYQLSTHSIMQNPSLREVSGLAVSQRNKGVLWALNDSGDKSFLYAVDAKGHDLGDIQIVGAQNIDWEDLSSFVYKGKSYLLVADVGDNLRTRDVRVLYIIEEPKLTSDKFYNSPLVEPVNKLKFRFDSGSLDCQAVAVDVSQDRIFLISKSESPPVLYALPLSVEQSDKVLTAVRTTEIPSFPQPTFAEMIASLGDEYFSSQPTGFDISSSGDRAIIVTYDSLLYFENKDQKPWSMVMSNAQPVILPIRSTDRVEAVSINPTGDQIYISSEQQPAPLITFSLSQKKGEAPTVEMVDATAPALPTAPQLQPKLVTPPTNP